MPRFMVVSFLFVAAMISLGDSRLLNRDSGNEIVSVSNPYGNEENTVKQDNKITTPAGKTENRIGYIL
ncbi:Uncharacterised protein at_DN1962, partial [Pycnogonum litorale]